MNIPYYVSNGYLICVVDILNNKPGQIASVTVNSVEGAAKYLTAKYPYINANKMGIQGHSFGGYETNLLVANSRMFAAAQSSAGFSNVITAFGELSRYAPLSSAVETGQFNMQTNPWENLELYVESSPVLRANTITTPLLIQNSKADVVVPFNQAIELFLALRRLQKPAWLLQYDGGGHNLFNEKQQLDFTIRQKQFFDHFLMDEPMPLWMSHGVPAVDKGIKSGLELDQADSALKK